MLFEIDRTEGAPQCSIRIVALVNRHRNGDAVRARRSENVVLFDQREELELVQRADLEKNSCYRMRDRSKKALVSPQNLKFPICACASLSRSKLRYFFMITTGNVRTWDSVIKAHKNMLMVDCVPLLPIKTYI